jgi:hypothetical protein
VFTGLIIAVTRTISLQAIVPLAVVVEVLAVGVAVRENAVNFAGGRSALEYYPQ